MRFDNLSPIALEELQELAFLRFTDAMLLKHVESMLVVRLPLRFRDTETTEVLISGPR